MNYEQLKDILIGLSEIWINQAGDVDNYGDFIHKAEILIKQTVGEIK